MIASPTLYRQCHDTTHNDDDDDDDDDGGGDEDDNAVDDGDDDIVVYCCCCLANHSMHRRLMSREPQPHFYINVADIDNLESEVSYIAC